MNTKWYIRPWYEWIGWAVWLVISIVFLQTAVASRTEVEPRAALLSWIIFFVLLAFAAVIWGVRIARQGETEDSQKTEA